MGGSWHVEATRIRVFFPGGGSKVTSKVGIQTIHKQVHPSHVGIGMLYQAKEREGWSLGCSTLGLSLRPLQRDAVIPLRRLSSTTDITSQHSVRTTKPTYSEFPSGQCSEHSQLFLRCQGTGSHAHEHGLCLRSMPSKEWLPGSQLHGYIGRAGSDIHTYTHAHM